LAAHCRSVADGISIDPLNVQLVFAPSVAESVDGSSHASAYQVRLSDSLLSRLKPVHIGPFEVCRLDAMVDVPLDPSATSASATALVPPAAGCRVQGTALVPPAGSRAAAGPGPGPAPVSFVSQGDVRLTELKLLLNKAGQRADFIDGVLVVGDGVRVRKDAANKLRIEGAYNHAYRKVRSLLYGQVKAV